MIIGTLMALETCLILGQVSHNLLYSTKKALDEYMWSGVRLMRKQFTSRPDHLLARVMEVNGKARQAEGEAKVVCDEQLHLENARKLREIYFIDPEDMEFKETIKNARKKLETSVAPASPAKL